MRRTAIDYASFMQELSETRYRGIDWIRLAQDNLSTHTPGSLYQVLAPQEAFELVQKFELHYTPLRAAGRIWARLSSRLLPGSASIDVSATLIGSNKKSRSGPTNETMPVKRCSGHLPTPRLVKSSKERILPCRTNLKGY